jgi:hypothetical protein
MGVISMRTNWRGRAAPALLPGGSVKVHGTLRLAPPASEGSGSGAQDGKSVEDYRPSLIIYKPRLWSDIEPENPVRTPNPDCWSSRESAAARRSSMRCIPLVFLPPLCRRERLARPSGAARPTPCRQPEHRRHQMRSAAAASFARCIIEDSN